MPELLHISFTRLPVPLWYHSASPYLTALSGFRRLQLKQFLAVPICVAGLALSSAAAQASTINATSVAYNNADTVIVNLGSPGLPQITGATTPAGQILVSTDTGATLPAWCIDLFYNLQPEAGFRTYSTGPISTDNNQFQGYSPATLTPMQVQEISGLINYGDALLANPATDTSDNSTAVQLAIWTVEYPDFFSYDTTSVTSGVNAEVAVLLGLAPSLTGDAIALTDTSTQNPTQTLGVAVPEPASFALLGAAMTGFGVARRRR